MLNKWESWEMADVWVVRWVRGLSEKKVRVRKGMFCRCTAGQTLETGFESLENLVSNLEAK